MLGLETGQDQILIDRALSIEIQLGIASQPATEAEANSVTGAQENHLRALAEKRKSHLLILMGKDFNDIYRQVTE